MQRPSLAATLEEEGLSDKFTVALDPYFPIVNIEVIGETPEQATATAQRLAQMVVDDVQARQDAYNVPSEKAISTLLLDDGSDLTPNNSSKRRAMVAVAGLGVLLTGATAVAVDALIYRRRRRPPPVLQAEAVARAVPAGPVPDHRAQRLDGQRLGQPHLARAPGEPGGRRGHVTPAARGQHAERGSLPRPPDSGNSAPSTGDDEPDARNEDSPSGYPATPSGSLPYDDDSTIVLPLKHAMAKTAVRQPLTAFPADLEPSALGERLYRTRRRLSYIDSSSVITLMVCVLLLLPTQLVVPAFASFGKPALLVSLLLFVWWIAARLHPRLTMTGPQPIRWAALAFVSAALASYAAGHSRGLPSLEASGADAAMLATMAMVGVLLMGADGIANRERLDAVSRLIVWCGAIIAGIGYAVSAGDRS